MKKLPFIHFLLEVLKASAKKHGLSKPLTLGHLLGIIVLANKLNKKHNGKVNRANRHPDLEPVLETAKPELSKTEHEENIAALREYRRSLSHQNP